MLDNQCKKCRRAGQKLFLKGERCYTQKCAIIKRAYAPGTHGKKRRPALSEYGTQLAEKQKLRNIYGLREKQLKNYFKSASKEIGVLTEIFLRKLETRLDNVIFRAGFAESRQKARQIVSHGHIMVNGRRVTVPSISVKKDDVIEIKPATLNKPLFAGLEMKIKKASTPDWFSLDKKTFKITINHLPQKEEIEAPADLQMIVEFYSR